MDYLKEYEKFVRAMGCISSTLTELVDDSVGLDQLLEQKKPKLHQLWETIEFQQRKNLMFKANEFAEKRLRNFGEILENSTGNFDVEKANNVTSALNFHTMNMSNLRDFFNGSFGKNIFTKWERIVVSDEIEVYQKRLSSIISILLSLKKTYSGINIPLKFGETEKSTAIVQGVK